MPWSVRGLESIIRRLDNYQEFGLVRGFFAFIVSGLLMTSFAAQRENTAPGGIQRVLLIDGTRSVAMRDIVASRKGRWGVVISKQYYIFSGPKAALRVKSTLPAFEFNADSAFDDPVRVFRLDTHSDRREIRVAKGTGGLAELSIPNDHIVDTRLEEIGPGENSNRRYRLKPTAPLRRGEYCLSRRVSICYEFGVD